MQATYKIIQNTDSSDLYGPRDATVHLTSTLKVPGGLKNFAFYSTYVQLTPPSSDPMSLLESQYYEGFMCTVRYNADDGGVLSEANVFRDTTCGTTELSSLSTNWRGFRAHLDGDEKCKANYRLDFEQSLAREEVQESGEKLGIVQCVVQRDFLVPNLFAIRMD